MCGYAFKARDLPVAQPLGGAIGQLPETCSRPLTAEHACECSMNAPQKTSLPESANGSASLLLTIPQAARELAVCRATVYALLAAGELRPVKVRASSRILRADVEAYIQRIIHQSSVQN